MAQEQQATTDTAARVLAIINDWYGVNATPETTFADLGADSLDVAVLSIELEDAFSIEVPDIADQQLTTVQSLIDLVAQLVFITIPVGEAKDSSFGEFEQLSAETSAVTPDVPPPYPEKPAQWPAGLTHLETLK